MLPFFQNISSSQLVEDWLRDDALSRLRTTFSAIEGAKLPMEPWEILPRLPSEMLDRVRIVELLLLLLLMDDFSLATCS